VKRISICIPECVTTLCAKTKETQIIPETFTPDLSKSGRAQIWTTTAGSCSDIESSSKKSLKKKKALHWSLLLVIYIHWEKEDKNPTFHFFAFINIKDFFLSGGSDISKYPDTFQHQWRVGKKLDCLLFPTHAPQSSTNAEIPLTISVKTGGFSASFTKQHFV